MKRLFKKREWAVYHYVDDQNQGAISCTGNFFEMIKAVFRIMTRKCKA